MAPPTLPQYIDDHSLGLNGDERHALRQHQQVALAGSRAASRASRHGRLLLDPSSLAALSMHFDRVMVAIQQRLQMVCPSSQVANHRL